MSSPKKWRDSLTMTKMGIYAQTRMPVGFDAGYDLLTPIKDGPNGPAAAVSAIALYPRRGILVPSYHGRVSHHRPPIQPQRQDYPLLHLRQGAGAGPARADLQPVLARSEEHTSELQSR